MLDRRILLRYGHVRALLYVKRDFNVARERDAEAYYVATVPELRVGNR